MSVLQVGLLEISFRVSDIYYLTNHVSPGLGRHLFTQRLTNTLFIMYLICSFMTYCITIENICILDLLVICGWFYYVVWGQYSKKSFLLLSFIKSALFLFIPLLSSDKQLFNASPEIPLKRIHAYLWEGSCSLFPLHVNIAKFSVTRICLYLIQNYTLGVFKEVQ